MPRPPPAGDPSIVPASRTGPLLFERLPGLAANVPWTPLAHVPTPIERCDEARAWLPPSCGVDVYMKRDDLVSPLYGGNKVRRFEHVLADALARGKKRLVTVGGLASTQAVATALFGRALGLDVSVVLFDQPVTTFARASIRALVAAGAEIVYGGGYLATGRKTLNALRKSKGCYFIAPGAAGPLANLGYVDAMLELAAQVDRGEAPRPDVILLPTGSSGTLAALALGAAHLGWNTEVLGVRITSALVCNRATVALTIRATDRFLASRDRRWRPARDRVRFALYGGAIGAGYGHPTAAAIEGARRVEALTGAPGEVTYSGKALAGLEAVAAMPRYRGKTFLLWNTLSTPRPTSPDVPFPADLAWMLDEEPVA